MGDTRSKQSLCKLLAAPSSLTDVCGSSSDESQGTGALDTPELSWELDAPVCPVENGMLL